MSDEVPPEGFVQLPRGLGFADSLQPCFLHIEDGRVSFGLFVQTRHSNSLGICHGGVLMTLADMAAATGVNVARGQRSGSPTVNLAVDFISGARLGDWIQADAEQVSVKRRFGFSNGTICNASGIVARFNGTFYLPDHDGVRKDGAPTDGILRVLDES
jgi:uncharacterized protein (TIGR00369 family)